MAPGTVSITIDELRVGVTCSHPIEGDSGVLLLGAKTRITQQVITGLRDRAIESIQVDTRDLVALRGTSNGKTKHAEKRTSDTPQWSPSKSVKEILVDRHDEGLSEERKEHLESSMGLAKERFGELKASLSTEKIRSVNELREISDVYASSMVDDHDQTIGTISRVTKLNDPDEHRYGCPCLVWRLPSSLV